MLDPQQVVDRHRSSKRCGDGRSPAVALFAAIFAAALFNSTAWAASEAAAFTNLELEHTFRFTYDVELPSLSSSKGPIDIFIPLATSGAHQTIQWRRVDASITGSESTEPKYGNHFWHGHLSKASAAPVKITVEYLVTRRAIRPSPATGVDTAREAPLHVKGSDAALFLMPDRLVPTSGALIERTLERLPAMPVDRFAKARVIYDYVIDTMEYKKVGEGWGRGDTTWACSQQYGNCTDFHALFLSLARASGVPSRFEIGFPVPMDQPSGEIAGYHCWINFVGDTGRWIPLDASEAWKHPDQRDRYFDSQPADRILFSIGRDLELGEGHTSGPLNFFIYPHVEVAGAVESEMRLSFVYNNVASTETPSAATRAGSQPSQPSGDSSGR